MKKNYSITTGFSLSNGIWGWLRQTQSETPGEAPEVESANTEGSVEQKKSFRLIRRLRKLKRF